MPAFAGTEAAGDAPANPPGAVVEKPADPAAAQPDAAAAAQPEGAAPETPDAAVVETPNAAVPETPEAAAAPAPVPAAAQVEFEPFNDQVFVAARKSGAPVVLYFEADWCAPCKKMHAQTFRAPAVLESSAGIRFFRVDMTKRTAYLSLVEKSFQILGAPTLILFGPDGKETGRRFGYVSAEEFVRMLGKSRKPAQST